MTRGKKDLYTHVVETTEKIEMLAQKYPIVSLEVIDGQTRSVYASSYQIGNLTLSLYEPKHFIIWVTATKKRIDLGCNFTTTIEKVVEGVEYLNEAIDFAKDFTAEEKASMLPLIDDAYTEYFGAEFLSFFKSFNRALKKHFALMREWEAANL